MPEGSRISDIPAAPQEILGVSEAREQLDRTAFEPEDKVEQDMEYEQAELIQNELLEIMPEKTTIKAGGTNSTFDISDQDPDQKGERLTSQSDTPPGTETPPTGTDETIGKSTFGSESSTAGDHYSGVEMDQGEVSHDSDWNEGESGTEPQSADEDGSTTEEPDSSKNSIEYVTAAAIENLQGVEDNSEEQSEAIDLLETAQEILSELESAQKDEEGATKIQDGDQKKSEDVDSSSDAYDQEMEGAAPGEVRGFVNDKEDNPYILEVNGESGENGKNQIIIPAGNSQIDFAGVAGEVREIDSFTWKLTVAKDETGNFRVPGLHGERGEIKLPDESTAGSSGEPVWGDGPAPEGLLSRVEDNTTVPKDQLDDDPSLQETDDGVEDMEDKLNEIGEDAQLANIDLQNMLQKQQQTIQMLSNISKVLEDTAMAVIRKVSGGGDSDSADTSESSGESTEGTTDPAIEAQAAALVEEVLAAETPKDAAALVQSVVRESYMENSQDLAFHAQKVKFFNECKKQVRTHLADLRNSTNTISEGENGTQIEEKAQDLNVADSQANSEGTESEYSYQLVEGRILVGETVAAEKTLKASPGAADTETSFIPGGSVISDAIEGMDALQSSIGDGDSAESSTDIQDGSDISEDVEKALDELQLELENLLEMVALLDHDLGMIENIISQNLVGIDGNYISSINYKIYKKQPDGSYKPVAAGGPGGPEDALKAVEAINANKNELLADIEEIENKIASINDSAS